MSRERLTQARRALESAVETADDGVRDPLRETAAALAELAAADRDPDPSVLDGHLNELRQLQGRADGETERRIADAVEYAESYREGLSNVS